METLKTKGGNTFPCNYVSVIPNPAQLYLRVAAPLPAVAAVFSDPGETAQLWFGEQYFAQYTRLISIAPEGETIRVCLGKE